MGTDGLDALLLLKPQNIAYLSGFNPIIQSHLMALILPADGEGTLIIHALRDRHARREAAVSDIRLYGQWGRVRPIAPSLFEAIRVVLGERHLESARLGFEREHLPVGLHDQLRAALPHAGFADAGSILTQARAVKSPQELALIRLAARVADYGMDAVLACLPDRPREIDLAQRAEIAMRELWVREYPDEELVDFGSTEGGIFSALWCYVLAGEHMNCYADCASARPIRDGDLVMSVIWTACRGYHAENERTAGVGPMQPEQQHAFDAVLEARATALPFLRPGRTCAEVYAAARDVFVAHGFGDALPGRIGHGIGLGAHEPPSLGPAEKTVLEPGMVFSFEPAIRIGEMGGVQHSDTVVITDQGCEFLTRTAGGRLLIR
jgi:Xaa-Pro dipeptidase